MSEKGPKNQKKGEPAEEKDHRDTLSKSWRECCLTSMVPFAVYYGIVGMVTSALSSFLTSQITTIEKQFGLSSSQSGILLSMNDAGFLITVVFVSYFGRNSHIPRILALCCFIYGISALTCTIPYLFTDNSFGATSSRSNVSTNVTSQEEGRLCSASILPPDTQECTGDQKNFYSAAKMIAMTLISSGMFLQGIAKSPRIPLVQTYIDDNVPKTSSGFYIGVVMSLAVFGPAISFGLGGSVSKIYVTLEETALTPRDPRWIGAWWLGFLIFGGLGILLSFPVCLFPRRLSNAPSGNNPVSSPSEQHKEQNIIQKAMLSVKGLLFRENEIYGIFIWTKLKLHPKLINDIQLFSSGILPALWRLARRPVYVFCVIASGVRVFGIAASIAFQPKYMQVYYGLSIFKSNMIVGFMGVGTAASAIFLSGILTRKLKLELHGMLKLIITTQIISSLLFLIGIFLVCPQPQIQDFDINVNQIHPLVKFSGENFSSCSAVCNCDAADFFPVCGSNAINYLSPCHAGCSGKSLTGYVDCLCISNSTTDPVSTRDVDATPGLCHSECSLYIVFATLQFFSSLLSGLAGIPGILVPIRASESRDKSLAIGISSFVSSLLGWFLGPIVMGYIIDSTCRLWSSSCSREGSCEIYDIRDYRLKYHGIDAAVSFTYILFYVLAYISLVRRSKANQYDVETKEQQEEMEVKPPAENPVS
ncbi:solute carrier organic anion transporter family member 1B3-like [Liolophura sinensis]|uniref:solute carrier organic anion transporter family member 1B3-like n=1 Tax=Liolophura sinensis TaxID=3198878 RepID=UPI00315882C6